MKARIRLRGLVGMTRNVYGALEISQHRGRNAYIGMLTYY